MVGGGDRQCRTHDGGVLSGSMAGADPGEADGRALTLGDARGTLWHGSAFIGGAAGVNDPVTPLLPGRFSWRLSPAVLLEA